MLHDRVSIAALLCEACELVQGEASARALAIVPVGVDDEVTVDGSQIVAIAAALLRAAIRATPAGGRIAVTAQEIEHELALAVYASGPPSAASSELVVSAADAAAALGGRVWSSTLDCGSLALCAVPLRDEAS